MDSSLSFDARSSPAFFICESLDEEESLGGEQDEPLSDAGEAPPIQEVFVASKDGSYVNGTDQTSQATTGEEQESGEPMGTPGSCPAPPQILPTSFAFRLKPRGVPACTPSPSTRPCRQASRKRTAQCLLPTSPNEEASTPSVRKELFPSAQDGGISPGFPATPDSTSWMPETPGSRVESAFMGMSIHSPAFASSAASLHSHKSPFSTVKAEPPSPMLGMGKSLFMKPVTKYPVAPPSPRRVPVSVLKPHGAAIATPDKHGDPWGSSGTSHGSTPASMLPPTAAYRSRQGVPTRSPAPSLPKITLTPRSASSSAARATSANDDFFKLVEIPRKAGARLLPKPFDPKRSFPSDEEGLNCTFASETTDFGDLQTKSLLTPSTSGGMLKELMMAEEKRKAVITMADEDSLSDSDSENEFVLATPMAIAEEKQYQQEPGRQRPRLSYKGGSESSNSLRHYSQSSLEDFAGGLPRGRSSSASLAERDLITPPVTNMASTQPVSPPRLSSSSNSNVCVSSADPDAVRSTIARMVFANQASLTPSSRMGVV